MHYLYLTPMTIKTLCQSVCTLCCTFLLSLGAYSQTTYYNPIITGVPFLGINTDVQSSGTAWVGVSNTGFYQGAGLYHNPALLATGEKYITAQTSYTSWFRHFVPSVIDVPPYYYGGWIPWIEDVNTGGYFVATGSVAAGLGQRHAVALNYTGYRWGTIRFLDFTGQTVGNHSPYEQNVNLRYAYRTPKGFALGTAVKYISSNLFGEFSGTDAAKAFAMDLGFNTTKRVFFNEGFDMKYSIGLSIINAGTKIRYHDPDADNFTIYYPINQREDFLPTELKVGFMVSPRIALNGDSTYLTFDVTYEMGKLLVPTLPSYQLDSVGNPMYDNQGNIIIDEGYDPNVGVFQGMVQSFYDAPGGISEEMNELMHKTGVEGRFVYNNQLFAALRLGYFYEHKSKGIGRFATFGAGFGYKGIEINYSRIFGTETTGNPLEGIWMLGVGYKLKLGENKGKPYSN